jgi:hypothetical protein
MTKALKALVAILVSTGLATSAYADTCSSALTGLFTPAQAVKLCAGSLVSSNFTFASTPGTIKGAGTLLMSPVSDANRVFTFAGASDSAISLLGGDGGVTATQTFTVATDTADGDDDGVLCLAGADACTTNGSRGAYITVSGNEASSTGDIKMQGGNLAGGGINLYAPHASSVVSFGVGTNSNDWNFSVANSRTVLHQKQATAGDVELSATGSALSIQEGTAASACMGTVTFNGTTAVTKSTTCATTGSRIFLTPTSDPTGATAAYCWVTNIVNATSFDVDCDQANDGTANWIIFHEAPAL